LKAEAQGKGFHGSKQMAEPGFDEFAPWGSVVKGLDEGDGWVHALGSGGTTYLPKTWNGSVVLRQLSDEQHKQLKIGHGINQTIADTFHQQFLKLATAEMAERLALSDHYVIWDSDVVLMQEFCPFNNKGQINFMEAAADTSANHTQKCEAHHDRAFHELTGAHYANKFRKKAGSTYTNHHMIVNRRAMEELLSTVRARSQKANSHWSTAILESACPNLEACACGISESGSYASWKKHTLPSLVAEVSSQGSNKPAELGSKQCCPFEYSFATEKRLGTLSVKFPREYQGVCKQKLHYKFLGRDL
jgi:hypothetical protein